MESVPVGRRGDGRRPTCERCRRQFQYPSQLRKHQERKTLCTEPEPAAAASAAAPTTELAVVATPEEGPVCSGCGRAFANNFNLSRHRQGRCPARKTTTTTTTRTRIRVDTGESESETLCAIRDLKSELSILRHQLATIAATPQVVNHTSSIHIHIIPFGQGLHISPEQLAFVCDTSRHFQAYLGMPPEARADTLQTIGLVLGVILDTALVVHTPLHARNVRMNPNRLDQVQVLTQGQTWQNQDLKTTTTVICDSVADAMRVTTLSKYADGRALDAKTMLVDDTIMGVCAAYNGYPAEMVQARARKEIALMLTNLEAAAAISPAAATARS